MCSISILVVKQFALFFFFAITIADFTADTLGLFGTEADDANAAPNAKRQKTGEDTRERRNKLFPWDTVAAQTFNPYWVSMLEQMSLKDTWAAASTGSKKAEFHTELAAVNDPYRVGVGVSRKAQTVKAAIVKLKSDANYKSLIVPALFTKAMAVADALLPALEALDGGKFSVASSERTVGFAGQRKKQPDAKKPPSMPEVAAAATKFHAWLSKDQCPLRGLLACLSGGGVFFAAHAADKTARSAIAHKPIPEDVFVHVAQERLVKQSEQDPEASKANSSKDTEGLFGNKK